MSALDDTLLADLNWIRTAPMRQAIAAAQARAGDAAAAKGEPAPNVTKLTRQAAGNASDAAVANVGAVYVWSGATIATAPGTIVTPTTIERRGSSGVGATASGTIRSSREMRSSTPVTSSVSRSSVRGPQRSVRVRPRRASIACSASSRSNSDTWASGSGPASSSSVMGMEARASVGLRILANFLRWTP